MKNYNKKIALASLAMWVIGILLLIYFNHWVNHTAADSGIKVVVIFTGIIVLLNLFRSFKKTTT